MENLSFSFSTVRAMSLLKVVGKNTFEWKIQLKNVFQTKWIENFYIDGHRFNIVCDPNLYSNLTKNLYHFRLYPRDNWIYPISYTFSILDRKGHVFVTSKGKMPSYEDKEKRTLMIIDAYYLNTFNLTENGTITVRFSVDRELDAQGDSHPTEAKVSNVADGATNTNPCVTKDSSTNTDGGDTSLLEILSNDFSTFYENKTDTDCVLKVSDDQFYVHRAVLSARSSVFSAMFHHDTAENRSGEVNIPDVKATVFSDVLYYVYSGKIRGLTADTATSIYTVADKYDLPELRTECLEFFKSNLTMNNFCEAALLAHAHGEMELEERVVWFIEEKLDEVVESSAWQQFLKDKTLLSSKLLTSALMSSKKRVSRYISKSTEC